MTTGINFNNTPAKLRILIAPLEWGLGHATRCIPIIHAFLNNDCDVVIAAEGAIQALLSKEFPDLEFLPLMGYYMKYSRRKFFLAWKLLSQFPKIFLIIRKEHQWLNNIVQQHKIDAVISDNRFGLYTNKVPCVYITHQLLIKTGNRFTEKIAQRIHYNYIKKYNECWVPDFEENSLAGELSHPVNLPKNVKYIGALSRFKKAGEENKYDLLIAISGPEPQRTLFEKQILNELISFTGKVLFVRGLPDQKEKIFLNELVEIKNHLSSTELNIAIEQSEIIISRSGYTTVMDLVKLKKKAILIPTPGQTEQEYLASYLMVNKMFYSVEQENFSLKSVLDSSKNFQFNIPAYDMEQYKKVIHEFVESLRTRRI